MHSTSSELIQVASQVAGRQADSDQHLIELWLFGRSKHTQRAYRRDVNHFMEASGKNLHAVRLGDLQKYIDSIQSAGLESASTYRKASAIKSLFTFGHRLGYFQFNVAAPLKLPAVRNKLSQRILDKVQVQQMIALEPNPRNRAMLLVFYMTGLRVAELCSLKWSDVLPRDEDGQLTVFGKGGKTRTILIPERAWAELVSIKVNSNESDPVFKSRKAKGHLTESQVFRIVQRSAQRAGIPKNVSCHWLRHAHASHALDAGAPISLVQSTLGHSSVATTGRYLHACPTESSGSYLCVE